jgi:RHS repeat-associated protein
MDADGSPAGTDWKTCSDDGTRVFGYGAFEANGLPCWSLIGRFGSSGEAFEVGDSVDFQATGGEFYLGVNDNYYPDNTGSWSATISAGTVSNKGLDYASSEGAVHSPSCTRPGTGSDPVNCASGDFWESPNDISVNGRGPGLHLSRTYNSLGASTEGIFGYGWSSSYDMHLTCNADSSVSITEEDGSQVNVPMEAVSTGTDTFTPTYVPPAWADSTLTENGTDICGQDSWVYVRHQTTTFAFNAAGQLTSITDRNGYATSLSYNGSSQLTTVTDSAGRTITFVYGTNGLVSQVTDPAGRVTKYGYDSSYQLTSVTDPLNHVAAYTYDTSGNHLLMTDTNPNSGVTTNVFDSSGRITKQTDPAGLVTTYAYSGDNFSSTGGTTTITDPHGNVEVENYTDGELMTLTKAHGTSAAATWTYTYDQTLLGTATVTDPNSHTTTNTYDAEGNLLTSKDGLGNTTTYTYNSFNEPLTITKPSGMVTTNIYDAKGNLLTTSTTPAGASGSPYSWSSADADGANGFNDVSCPSVNFCVGIDYQDIVTSTDPTGGASSWHAVGVDGLTQIYGISCPSTTLCVAVDGYGNALTSTDPTGPKSAWTFDGNIGHGADGTNAMYAISCPSVSLCVAIDGNGNVVTSTNPQSGIWTVTNLESTALGFVSCPTTTLCVVPDTAGNVFTATNPTGGASAWSKVNVDGSANIWADDCPSPNLCLAVDVSGNILTSTNPTGGAGAWHSSNVDGTNQYGAVACPSDAFCVATDQNGNAFTSTNPTGGPSAWTKTDVDGSHPLYGVSCPSADLCVAADGVGNMLTMTSADPTSVNLYKNATLPGVVTETIDPAGHVTTYGYDTYGDVTSTTTYPTSTQSDTTLDVYDADGEKVCEADPPAVTQGVTCPAAGSSRVAETSTWTYDADGEVTQATNADGQSTNTAYDGDGNVLTVTDALSNVTKNTYDADDRLATKTTGYGSSTAATTSDAYDIAPGTSPCSSSVTGVTFCNTVTNGLSQVTVDYYNALDQGIEAVAPGSITTSYTYDGVGNRLTTTTAAGTTTDGYDTANELTSITYSGTASGYTAPHNVAYTFNSDGLRTQMTDGTGTTSYTYNGLDELTSTQNGASATLGYTYDLDGETTSITYPNAKTVHYTYDLAGNTASLSDFQGRSTTFSNQPSSPLVSGGSQSTTDLANGAMSIAATDAAGQPTTNETLVPNAASSSAWTSADADGTNTFNAVSCPSTTLCLASDYQNIANSTNPTGGTSAWSSTYVDGSDQIYGLSCPSTTLCVATDGYGDLISTTTPTGPKSGWNFHAADGTKAIYSISCPSTTLCVAVDNGGNVVTSTTPAVGSWTVTNIDTPYISMDSISCPTTSLCVATDVRGDVFTSTNPTGGASAWVETSVDASGSDPNVECASVSLCLLSDGNGDVFTSTNPTSGTWTEAAIDPGVVLSQASCPSTSLCVLGDNNGNILFSTNPTGGIGAWSMANIDPSHEIEGVSCPSTSLCVAADNNGHVFATTTPTADQGVLSYANTNNTDGEITTAAASANGTSSNSVSYGYTANDQVSSSTATGITNDTGSYAYDSAGELTTVVSPATGTSDTQSFNSSDELYSALASGTTTTYGYDSIGARTSATIGSGSPSGYTYSQTGELMSAAPAGGSTYSYAYNGDGLRMSKTVSSTTESYTWDPTSENLLVDASTNFLYGPSGVVEQEDNTTTGDPLYYLQDSSGSTRALLNQTGTVAATYTYDTYGAVASHTGSSSTPIGYDGAYTDAESGFLYLVHRYYDPATGQFLTVDPLVNETNAPYFYAADNPANNTDVSGLMPVCGGDCGGPRNNGATQPGNWVAGCTHGNPNVYFPGTPPLVGAILGFSAQRLASLLDLSSILTGQKTNASVSEPTRFRGPGEGPTTEPPSVSAPPSPSYSPSIDPGVLNPPGEIPPAAVDAMTQQIIETNSFYVFTSGPYAGALEGVNSANWEGVLFDIIELG